MSARVPDANATRLQAIMDRSAVNVRERAGVYRQGGWQAFNAKETPYTADQVRKERELYMRDKRPSIALKCARLPTSREPAHLPDRRALRLYCAAAHPD